MKPSIRKFLLVNLLLALTITTSLTAIGNYYLDQKDIQEHLDSLMAVTALSYEALLGSEIEAKSLGQIEKALTQVPQKLDVLTPEKKSHTLAKRFLFQIWDKNGQLLLSNPKSSKLNIRHKSDGFHSTLIDGNRWREFITTHPQTGHRILLAEEEDTRNELGHRITQDDFYIMLLTFPLAGFLIWMIIGRGLKSLDRVAEEVANRAPVNLEPVDLDEIPEEISPVIDELNKLFHRLHEGFEREKRFAADAAHELKTPLAALKTQAQVALNCATTEEKDAALQKLIRSVNRSTHIVQQLLTMSRMLPESHAIHEHHAVFLPKISRETLAMLAPYALKHYIELELEHQETVSMIPGNATALGILLRNLVDNAIRYSKPGGKVSVRIYEDETHVVLEVADNGPGIPEELRQRVFERFFRVLGNQATGSGLGLAIVQQIVSLHQAQISLDSPKEGTGLIVRVRFLIDFGRDGRI